MKFLDILANAMISAALCILFVALVNVIIGYGNWNPATGIPGIVGWIIGNILYYHDNIRAKKDN